MKQQAGVRRSLNLDAILLIYLWIVMAGLLLQGSGSLALRLSPQLEAITPPLLAGIFLGHIPHAILHIVWGATGMLVLATLRSNRERLVLGLSFGIFYTLLAIYGTIDNNALGLHLVFAENGFHLIVGPLTLGLSLLTWFTQFRDSHTQKEQLPSL